MVNKLEDDIPTTTITFDSFPEIAHRLEAINFQPEAYPEDEGVEVLSQKQHVEVYTFDFQIKDDSSYPSSGDSCSTKYQNLRDLVKAGGDNEELFSVTFDREDSTQAAPVELTYTGKVKLLKKRSVAGKHRNYIDGSFEFWLDDQSQS